MPHNQQRSWKIFTRLTVVLLLGVFFPVRFFRVDTRVDIVIYSLLALACVVMAFRTYRRQFVKLALTILLCALLSGYQVFNLTVVREDIGRTAGNWENSSWYNPRELTFHQNGCNMVIREDFIGHALLISLTIWTVYEPWPQCGH